MPTPQEMIAALVQSGAVNVSDVKAVTEKVFDVFFQAEPGDESVLPCLAETVETLKKTHNNALVDAVKAQFDASRSASSVTFQEPTDGANAFLNGFDRKMRAGADSLVSAANNALISGGIDVPEAGVQFVGSGGGQQKQLAK